MFSQTVPRTASCDRGTLHRCWGNFMAAQQIAERNSQLTVSIHIAPVSCDLAREAELAGEQQHMMNIIRPLTHLKLTALS